MKYNNIKGSFILLTAAFLWGMAFVAQGLLAESVPPFAINFLRSYIAVIFLLGFIFIRDFKSKIPLFPKEKTGRKKLLTTGLFCGIAMWAATNLQQFGIGLYPKGVPSEARAGFLTALYVILVPAAMIFFKRRVHITVWLAVIISIIGIYILCASEGFSGIYLSDILIILSAVAFTTQILIVDMQGADLDGVKLSLLQFFVCGTISLLTSLILEQNTFTLSGVIDGILPLLYLGIVSSGIAYTLQIVGQKYANPAVASIVMSLESVFAALGGLMFGKTLAPHEIIGCSIMFAAIIIAQISDFLPKKVKA